MKTKINIDAETKNGQTALLMCSILGFDNIAQLLIEAGSDVDKQTRFGLSYSELGAYREFNSFCFIHKLKVYT